MCLVKCITVYKLETLTQFIMSWSGVDSISTKSRLGVIYITILLYVNKIYVKLVYIDLLTL